MAKVAIVDSGLDWRQFEKNYIGGYNCCDKNSNVTDLSGHGTACAWEMVRVNTNVFIYIVKVLNENNLGSSAILCEALKLLANVDVDVINLSIAVFSKEMLQHLQKQIDMLLSQGKKIVVASANDESKLNELFRISGIIRAKNMDKLDGQYSFAYDYFQNIVYTKKTRTLIQLTPNRFIPFEGNSKAAARTTGMLSLLIDENREMGHDITIKQKQYMDDVFPKFIRRLKDSLIKCNRIADEFDNINSEIFTGFFAFFKQEVGVDLNSLDFCFEDFYNLHSIANFLQYPREYQWYIQMR